MNSEEKKLMGLRIKASRLKINLSQEELAEKLNMKRTNIANYEAGRVVPPGNVLMDLSEILGVTSDYILGISNNPQFDIDEEYKKIERFARRISEKDRKKAITILEAAFEEAFNEINEEDEEDI